MRESIRNGIQKLQLHPACKDDLLSFFEKHHLIPLRYMISAAIGTVFNRCDILTLRALNIFGLFGIFFTAFGFHLRRKRQNKTIRKQVLTEDEDIGFLERAYDTHTSLNIALFPPLFFFSVLYYTDVLSTLYVMMSYDLYLRSSNLEHVGWRASIEMIVSGLLALSCRQTNIFWVAIFPAGLGAIQVLKTAAGQRSRRDDKHRAPATLIECAGAAWSAGYVHDSPVLGAHFTGS